MKPRNGAKWSARPNSRSIETPQAIQAPKLKDHRSANRQQKQPIHGGMAPAQISLANAYATILAAVFYAAALVVFVVYGNSDAGRAAVSGLQLELTDFVLYFLYFGLFLGFVTALTKLAPGSRRVVLGVVAAIIVAPLGYAG